MIIKSIYVTFTVILSLAAYLSGCSPREVIREGTRDTAADELHLVEEEFTPSDYNSPFALEPAAESDSARDAVVTPYPETATLPEYMQGFRIQLHSTSDIEAAQEVYNFADSLFTDYWIYIVYEVPFYKVRLGDFETRPQANRMMADIIRKGFRDAWVVPDRVVKDPPEKNPPDDYRENRDPNRN